MDPIEPDDLSPPKQLTKSYFRATNPHLDTRRFEAKWARAFESPLRFLRAFPQAWYLDLAQVPVEHIPGKTAMCFGDLHPENFGFVVAGGKTHFVFNDFDDSGLAEVGLDALRWFTAYLLWTCDRKATDSLIDHYRDVMRAPGKATPLPDALWPAPEQVVAKQRKKFLAGDALVRSRKTRLGAADAKERAVVTKALAALDWQVLDVAERERDHGGSGGLRRFWALAVPPAGGEGDVLELKELSKPATSWGHAQTPLIDRLAEAKKALWAGVPASDHFTVKLGTADFVVRSRLTRANLDVEELEEDELDAALAAQVGLVAKHHRKSFVPGELQSLDDWLQASVRVLAERWTQVFERLRP